MTTTRRKHASRRVLYAASDSAAAAILFASLRRELFDDLHEVGMLQADFDMANEIEQSIS